MTQNLTEPDTACQCARFPDRPCESRMTQEDLLCDTCRKGCLGAWKAYVFPGDQHFGIEYIHGISVFRWGNG